MDQTKDQRVCIKFCANLGKSAAEVLTMMQQAFGDQMFSRTQVFQWHARFKAGRKSVDDDEHTGRSTSCTTPETVARIQELVRQDRRRTIHDIAGEVGIGYGTCQRVLTKELGMHRVAAKFVPRLLHHDNARLTFPSSPSSFWRNTKRLSSPTHRTPLISHPVTSYFQK
jgi:hypothetical protein